MADPIVEISDMCYSCNGQDILHDINLTLHEGDFVAIIGPNGGGKTTLLKLILGILTPTRGTIRINSQEPCSHVTSIGYVPQNVNHNLSFPATALDIVLMGKYEPARRFQRGNAKQNRREALAVMDKLQNSLLTGNSSDTFYLPLSILAPSSYRNFISVPG